MTDKPRPVQIHEWITNEAKKRVKETGVDFRVAYARIACERIAHCEGVIQKHKDARSPFEDLFGPIGKVDP